MAGVDPRVGIAMRASLLVLVVVTVLSGCFSGAGHFYSIVNESGQAVLVRYTHPDPAGPLWAFRLQPGEGGQVFGGLGEDEYIGGTIEVLDLACVLRAEIAIVAGTEDHRVTRALGIERIPELPEAVRGQWLEETDDPCTPGLSTEAP